MGVISEPTTTTTHLRIKEREGAYLQGNAYECHGGVEGVVNMLVEGRDHLTLPHPHTTLTTQEGEGEEVSCS